MTPLHVAVLAHNALVKEMRTLENPCSYMTSELANKRCMYMECIRTLMHMGASYGTKVTVATTKQSFFTVVNSCAQGYFAMYCIVAEMYSFLVAVH